MRDVSQHRVNEIQHRFFRVKCHVARHTGASHVLQLKVSTDASDRTHDAMKIDATCVRKNSLRV